VAAVFRKGARAPVRRASSLVWNDPDLEDSGGPIFKIVFRVRYSAARRHDLHVTRLGAALIAHVVAMRDRARADVGNDLQVVMRMRRKAGLRGDRVVVPDTQVAPMGPFGIMIAGEGEMMMRVQ